MARKFGSEFSKITPASRISEANSLRNSRALRASFPILNRSAQGIFCLGQGIFFAPARKSRVGQGIPAVSASWCAARRRNAPCQAARASAIKWAFACSSAATTISRVTVGNRQETHSASDRLQYGRWAPAQDPACQQTPGSRPGCEGQSGRRTILSSGAALRATQGYLKQTVPAPGLANANPARVIIGFHNEAHHPEHL